MLTVNEDVNLSIGRRCQRSLLRPGIPGRPVTDTDRFLDRFSLLNAMHQAMHGTSGSFGLSQTRAGCAARFFSMSLCLRERLASTERKAEN